MLTWPLLGQFKLRREVDFLGKSKVESPLFEASRKGAVGFGDQGAGSVTKLDRCPLLSDLHLSSFPSPPPSGDFSPSNSDGLRGSATSPVLRHGAMLLSFSF